MSTEHKLVALLTEAIVTPSLSLDSLHVPRRSSEAWDALAAQSAAATSFHATIVDPEFRVAHAGALLALTGTVLHKLRLEQALLSDRILLRPPDFQMRVRTERERYDAAITEARTAHHKCVRAIILACPSDIEPMLEALRISVVDSTFGVWQVDPLKGAVSVRGIDTPCTHIFSTKNVVAIPKDAPFKIVSGGRCITDAAGALQMVADFAAKEMTDLVVRIASDAAAQLLDDPDRDESNEYDLLMRCAALAPLAGDLTNSVSLASLTSIPRCLSERFSPFVNLDTTSGVTVYRRRPTDEERFKFMSDCYRLGVRVGVVEAVQRVYTELSATVPEKERKAKLRKIKGRWEELKKKPSTRETRKCKDCREFSNGIVDIEDLTERTPVERCASECGVSLPTASTASTASTECAIDDFTPAHMLLRISLK